jgi:maltose O-acetyltransferase
MIDQVHASAPARLAIALAGDEHYVPGLFVSLASVLTHLPAELELDVVVIDEGLSGATHEALRSLVSRAAPEARLKVVPGFVAAGIDAPTSGHLTQATYGRLLMPHLSPEVNAALYLDSDTLTRTSVADLLVTELGGSPLGAVMDADASTHAARQRHGELRSDRAPDEPYINAGVLLMDLDIWRDRDLGRAVLGYIESHRDQLRFHDQDAINVVLGSEIKLLDGAWNYQLRAERAHPGASLEDAAIIHFSDPVKPWATLNWLRQSTVARQASVAWWRVALFSPCLPAGFRIRLARRFVTNALKFATGQLKSGVPRARRLPLRIRHRIVPGISRGRMHDYVARAKEYILNRVVNEVPFVKLRMWLYGQAGLGLVDHSTGMVMLRTELHAVRNITIGPNTIIGQRCILDGRGTITIGRSVNIGSGTSLQTGKHLIDDPNFAADFGAIVVHDMAWIAEGCRVLAGVTIGEGAVVAAGAVVAKDVGPYEVVGGIPATHIRMRARPMNYLLTYRGDWL